jgi:hypothetical protein
MDVSNNGPLPVIRGTSDTQSNVKITKPSDPRIGKIFGLVHLHGENVRSIKTG